MFFKPFYIYLPFSTFSKKVYIRKEHLSTKKITLGDHLLKDKIMSLNFSYFLCRKVLALKMHQFLLLSF